MELWLAEYGKPNVEKVMRARFEKFLEWSGKTPQQLVDQFNQQDARNQILRFQTWLQQPTHTIKNKPNHEKLYPVQACVPN